MIVAGLLLLLPARRLAYSPCRNDAASAATDMGLGVVSQIDHANRANCQQARAVNSSWGGCWASIQWNQKLVLSLQNFFVFYLH